MSPTTRIALYLAAVTGGFVLARRMRSTADQGLVRSPDGGLVNPFVAQHGPLINAARPSPSPAPGPAPAPSYPQALASYDVVPGGRYAAAVRVSAPLSWAASASSVRSQAEKQEFTNVDVQTARPMGWPGSQAASYYVHATYLGQPKTLDKSYASGQVKVLEAWRVG